MGTWGIGHWLVVLLIAVLLCGTKKLGKSFRKGLQDDEHSAQAQLKADPLKADPTAPPAPAGGDAQRDTTP